MSTFRSFLIGNKKKIKSEENHIKQQKQLQSYSPHAIFSIYKYGSYSKYKVHLVQKSDYRISDY